MTYFCLHLLKRKLTCFDAWVSDPSFASLHVLHINYVSEQTFGLVLKFETSFSAKNKATRY